MVTAGKRSFRSRSSDGVAVGVLSSLVAVPSRLVVFAFPAYGMWRGLGIDDLGSVGLGFTKMRL